MELNPISSGLTVIDFAGNEYVPEDLPYARDGGEPLQVGDTCEISWPGGSGWYTTGYTYEEDGWTEMWSTAPWQMKA